MKYEYIVVKSHPNLFEEKLQEYGKAGWKYINLTIEQSMLESKIFAGKQPELVTNYAIIFEKTIAE